MNLSEIAVLIDDILLDPNNYRFIDNDKFKRKIDTKFHIQSVQETTLVMLEKTESYQLGELKSSILNNGFVPIEKVVLKKYEHEAGKYVVVEGNRRVATLKILLSENRNGVAALSPDQITEFTNLKCLLLEASNIREAERTIMGIRHIAGAKNWGAYQQAQLIHELVDEEGHQIDEVAEKLGMTKVEANKRYRAMKALKQMEDDDEYHDKAKKEFYQLFRELVTTPAVRETFGWNHAKAEFTDIHKARQFYELIAPQTDGSSVKLVTYNDVRRLRIIIGNPLALECLFDPDRSFREAISIAEPELKSKMQIDSSAISNYLSFITSLPVDSLISLDAQQVEMIRMISTKSADLVEMYEKLMK